MEKNGQPIGNQPQVDSAAAEDGPAIGTCWASHSSCTCCSRDCRGSDRAEPRDHLIGASKKVSGKGSSASV